MLTRRQFLQYGAASGVAIAVPVGFATAARRTSTTALDPASITKYASALRVLPAMPVTRRLAGFDYYELSARQFLQQVLPANLPATTVWGYGSTSVSGSFSAPAFTIEAQVNRPVRVKWGNGLVDRSGRFLAHPLTVDPTLHWANPPGGKSGRDMRPHFTSTPPPYAGPVPLVTHLHGAHSDDFSDG